MRIRRPSLTAALLVALGVAGCGGSGSSAVRLGCHQFCQQAGGFGGGPAGQPAIRIDTGGEVVPLSDGTVVIKQTCLLPVRCRGALLIGPAAAGLASACPTSTQRVVWWGQSDLLVAAHRSGAFGVPLTSCARRLLANRGRLAVDVTADTGLVPACAKIPALADACRRFVTRPGYTPDQGDGVNRLVSKRIVLVAPRSGG